MVLSFWPPNATARTFRGRPEPLHSRKSDPNPNESEAVASVCEQAVFSTGFARH